MVEVGDVVVFVDPFGKEYRALVTTVFGGGERPSVNVVYVSSDEAKTDQYGRQVERSTSVVHEGSQPAHGMYWKEAAPA